MEITSTRKSTLNPFRPGAGLFPPCLAGRVSVLEVFSERLYATITGSPRNLIICGDKRMGKTCLLIKMEEISFVKKLLTVSTITSHEDLRSFVYNLAIRIYSEIKVQNINVNGELEKAITEFQQLPLNASIPELEIGFAQYLSNVWQQIEQYVPAIFITVDDIDLVVESKEALLLIHKVTQNLYRKNCPIIFAVSCSLDFFGKNRKKHSKLIDSFEMIPANRLLRSSLENAIRVPLWNLEISYDEAVIREIARLSDGFPFYLQHMAHYVFEEMNDELDTLALRRGYEKSMRFLKRDIFAPLEREIPLNEKKILLAIHQAGNTGFSELLKRVKLPRGSVASCLKRLKEKQLIQQEKKQYRITDNLFGEYLEKQLTKGWDVTSNGFVY